MSASHASRWTQGNLLTAVAVSAWAAVLLLFACGYESPFSGRDHPASSMHGDVHAPAHKTAEHSRVRINILRKQQERLYNRVCGKQQWTKQVPDRHIPWAHLAKRKSHNFQRHGAAIYPCREHDDCRGLADRVSGAVSVFAYGLATHRQFYFDWFDVRAYLQPGHCKLDWSFDSSLIEPYNWTLSHVSLMSCLNGFSRRLCTRYFNELLKYNKVPDDQEEPVGEAPDKADIVEIRTNRGRLAGLLSHPDMKVEAKPLRDLGFDVDTAFGCALHCLFQPVDAALELVAEHAMQLIEPDCIAIGIHIRVGDRGMHKEDQERFELFNAYFNLAEAVEKTLSPEQRKHVVWLVVTDSPTFKKHVASKFKGKKQVIVTDIRPEHINIHWEEIRYMKNSKPKPADMSSAISSVAEWYLLSLCDYYVIQPHSGFARTAAALSLSLDKIIVPLGKDLNVEQKFQLTELKKYRDLGAMF